MTRIAVVAPSSRFPRETAERVSAFAAEHFPAVELVFHPQCFLCDHHFAGDDMARLEALVEVANDPGFDAIWFARGGYGSCRIAEDAIAAMGPPARDKAWLGYSDAGFLLAGLYRAGFSHLFHGPMPRDIDREGGEEAIQRALGWLAGRDPAALEPGLMAGQQHAAFNIVVLCALLGTPLEPDLSGHVLLLEEVAEHHYAIDRWLFHLTANEGIRRIDGLRLGRCSEVPDNDPPFGHDEEEIARYWCARAGIPWLGRADIGHDSGNKIVPFGPLEPL